MGFSLLVERFATTNKETFDWVEIGPRMGKASQSRQSNKSLSISEYYGNINKVAGLRNSTATDATQEPRGGTLGTPGTPDTPNVDCAKHESLQGDSAVCELIMVHLQQKMIYLIMIILLRIIMRIKVHFINYPMQQGSHKIAYLQSLILDHK